MQACWVKWGVTQPCFQRLFLPLRAIGGGQGSECELSQWFIWLQRSTQLVQGHDERGKHWKKGGEISDLVEVDKLRNKSKF